MPSHKLLNIAKRLKTMSHIGLTYASNDYDVERYKELEQISFELMSTVTDHPLELLSVYFESKKEYITPKVDIRAVIFNDKRELLMVQERADGKWSIPGGWADIGLSPTEIAVKEALEETGFAVSPIKLLAVMDKRQHSHPPELDYVYKIFIQCQIIGGQFNQAFDILDKGFFAQDNLPPLSIDRVTQNQINLMFDYLDDPTKEASVD